MIKPPHKPYLENTILLLGIMIDSNLSFGYNSLLFLLNLQISVVSPRSVLVNRWQKLTMTKKALENQYGILQPTGSIWEHVKLDRFDNKKEK